MRREHERREHIRREFDDERRPRRDGFKEEFKREFRKEFDKEMRHGGPWGHPRRHNKKMTTKLFTDKQELVKYVNEIGEKGAKIDIFKIEDDLYKVEVIERIKKDIEIEVE